MPRIALALVAALALAAPVLGVSTAAPEARGTDGVICNGKERWDVKTLSDPAAGTVELAPDQIRHIKVSTLRRKQPATAVGNETPRTSPVETTVYEVEAALIEARWEWNKSTEKGDRDIHLVIADPSDHDLRMIVELPDPACVAAEPALQKMMRDARAAFVACKGLMPALPKPFQPLSGTATINGVGFFDRLHGQKGRAPHGIELHPVLFFSSSDCP